MFKNKILIINGVNLDLLGSRETKIYGTKSLDQLQTYLIKINDNLKIIYQDISWELEFFQTNEEHLFLEKLSEKKWSALLVNAGAWTHTSLAIADRLSALNLPFIEVHLSNIMQREKYRQKSYLSAGSMGGVYGLGFSSYSSGLLSLLEYLSKKQV